MGDFEWMKIIFSILLRECKMCGFKSKRKEREKLALCFPRFPLSLLSAFEVTNREYFFLNLQKILKISDQGKPPSKILRLKCWWTKLDREKIHPGQKEPSNQQPID